MKRRSYTITILLALLMVLVFAGSAFGQTFPDVNSSHPYYQAIETMAGLDEEIAKTQEAIASCHSAGEWKEMRRQLLDVDLLALWNEATNEERRQLIASVFSRIYANREKMTFFIHGCDLPVEVMYIVDHIAGARRELTMYMPEYSIVKNPASDESEAGMRRHPAGIRS